MENNKEIKEAIDVYDNITTDMGEINAAIRREMYLSDIATLRGEAIEEGLKEGIEQGIKQGIEQGIKQGEEQGAKKAKKEIARKMLEANKPIEEIMEYTELTKEEIEKIK